jgi:hypothetical protein
LSSVDAMCGFEETTCTSLKDDKTGRTQIVSQSKVFRRNSRDLGVSKSMSLLSVTIENCCDNLRVSEIVNIVVRLLNGSKVLRTP